MPDGNISDDEMFQKIAKILEGVSNVISSQNRLLKRLEFRISRLEKERK
jgi:hypothetical protein